MSDLKSQCFGHPGMDWGLYKYRHLVENIFARLKHFRGVATRYDKLKQNYVRNYVSIVVWHAVSSGYRGKTSTGPGWISLSGTI